MNRRPHVVFWDGQHCHTADSELGSPENALSNIPRGERVIIAVLPPAADLRSISIPGSGLKQARLIIQAAADRIFLSPGRKVAVPIQRFGNHVVAVAADVGGIELIVASVCAAGLHVIDVVPAHTLWHAAARRRASAKAPFVLLTSYSQRLFLTDNEYRIIRHLPADIADGQLESEVRAVLSATGATHVVGIVPEVEWSGWSAKLQAAADQEAVKVEWIGEPLGVAAQFAAASTSSLLPPEERERRARRNRRQASAVTICALIGLLGAWIVHTIGLSHETRVFRLERAAITGSYQHARRVLNEATELEDRLKLLLPDSPSTTHLLIGIANSLPEDAYLSKLTLQDSAVEVAGLAIDSRGVVAAMSAVQGLDGVRISAPPVPVTVNGAELENFAIVGRRKDR